MNPKAPSTVLTAETKPARVPKLRFPEFRGAEGWKSIPLSRLAIRAKQKNRDEKIGRVLTNSAEFGVVDQRDFFDKDIATQGKLEGYFVVELGSYVYNPRISSTAPVGPISKNKIGTGVMSPLYTVFKFKDDRNDFYEHFFKTTGWHTYMRQASSTGARHDRMAISSDDFMAMPLPVPSPDEQQKIAECLSSVDELMAAQAWKVDALKTHKKGLMQQLFPTEGETQPRLRFPEFQNAEEWEVQRLDELTRYENGKAHENDISENGRYIVVNSKFISTEGEVRKFSNEGFCVADEGNVLMVLSDVPNGRAIAKCYFVESDDLYTVNQRICRIQPTKVNGKFLFYVLDRNSYFLDFDDGIKQTNLRKEDVVGFPLCVPPQQAEQQRIASCLSSLDALITAETQKLEALKTHKKGLMQQLFPAPEETATS